MSTPAPGAPTTTIGLYVCTHQRNEELRRLLRSVRVAADRVSPRARVGVVVVDDNPDGRARGVADEFADVFPLGLRYRHVGTRNISRARNVGLAEASAMGEWVAMTDDDIVVPPEWFEAMLDVQRRTQADAVTGPLLLTFDTGPGWLRSQPFDEIGLLVGAEDERADACATGNSMIRTSWLRAHPDLRFEEDLGELGGEDMVFFRRAVKAGLEARYSMSVAVREIEPAQRATIGYQFRRALWMGNTHAVTNRRAGDATRVRLVLRGARRVLRAVQRPVSRVRSGQRPQLAFSAATALEGLGMVLGALEVKLKHR